MSYDNEQFIPSRMTADHPTREERYAAVRGLTSYGAQAGTINGRAYIWQDELAAALVAADPAPAQPDAAWPCDNHGEPNTCLSLRKAEAECCRVCRIRAADRILHAAQPVPAPEKRDVDAVARTLMAAWEQAEGKPVNVSYVATFADMARAVLAVPAPGVSRGVAEVKAEALREAADEMVGRGGTNPHARFLRDRADRIVRTAHPADEGADCCRERTTAGGCGCGRSGEGETS